MSKTKLFLAATLLMLTSSAATAVELPLAIPAGGRIGIINLMTPDVTHFHVGETQLKSFLRTYRATWSVAEVIDQPIILSLTTAGLEPVMLDPPEELRREKHDWIISNPQDSKLSRGCRGELERLIQKQRLSALIIVAPGANTDPLPVEGDVLRKLPEYIQGWGFSTSDEPDGIAKPAVFNLTQILLIQKTTGGVRLEYRDWGGNHVYEWKDFTPPPDIKKIPETEVAKLEPLITNVMKEQIARFMPHLQS